MLSKKKLAACRRNAKKSTGPRTAAGKKRAARNAVTHGLTSREFPLLPFENQYEYTELLEAMERDLAPAGVLQREVVNQITQICWKLRRIPAIEAELLKYEFSAIKDSLDEAIEDGELDEDAGIPYPTTPTLIAAHFARALDRPYERLEMYRQRLERSLQSNYRLFEKLRGKTTGAELSKDMQDDYRVREFKQTIDKAKAVREFKEELIKEQEQKPAGEVVRSETNVICQNEPTVPCDQSNPLQEQQMPQEQDCADRANCSDHAEVFSDAACGVRQEAPIEQRREE
jgi:hypothetical protein